MNFTFLPIRPLWLGWAALGISSSLFFLESKVIQIAIVTNAYAGEKVHLKG
jgi:hypothetical protein